MPECQCNSLSTVSRGLKLGTIIRKGFYRRKSDQAKIRAFFCHPCKRHFSKATFDPAVRQKKRHLNPKVYQLLCSGVSQNRSARILGVNQKTIARKLEFLGRLSRLAQQQFLESNFSEKKIQKIQFDELETSHHTKCKPLSIPLVVTEDRFILGASVAVMPAKGNLAKISRLKYGPRKNERPEVVRNLLSQIRPFLSIEVQILSDKNPYYSEWIHAELPDSVHLTVKGRKATVAGQGELKKGGFDPIFALNHTAAMFRANMNRLFRRTWCTTKKISSLVDHLSLYIQYHNQHLVNLKMQSQ